MPPREPSNRRRPKVAPGAPRESNSSADGLDALTPEAAQAVLESLLSGHPEMRPEAERIAANLGALTPHPQPSSDEVAQAVFSSITGMGLDELNERAGGHSWGYVEPSEAAWELLEEAIEDWIKGMKDKMASGRTVDAENTCIGVVAGLYRARNGVSDGPLGWAPDFPAEGAGQVATELVEACTPDAKPAMCERLITTLKVRTPEWAERLGKVIEGACGSPG